MLLPLAWLVRLEDTPEHRGWLRRIATDLLALQQPCGAIREQLGKPGLGAFRQTNLDGNRAGGSQAEGGFGPNLDGEQAACGLGGESEGGPEQATEQCGRGFHKSLYCLFSPALVKTSFRFFS